MISMKYTRGLLEEILQEGGATVLEEYPRYNQRLVIKFRCSCGAETSKKFEMLHVHRLPYCAPCSLKKKAENYKETCMEKYGVSNASKVPEVIEKINDTFTLNYGIHPKKTKGVQDKWKATCLEKYGGHPNQNKEVQAKSEATSFHYKDYMMPSGMIVKYQGYENLALEELVQQYEEEDICCGRLNIPTVDYYINEKKHVYFPDIYIKSENKIIEVKSEWTITLKRGNVEEKALATVKAGYRYEIWVYNDKKVKVETKVY
jgi:hypothetical protein